METISIQKIRWIKSLHLKKNREKENLFIVEGEKIIDELIKNHHQSIHYLVGLNSFFDKSDEWKSLPPNSVFKANTEEMERISTLNTASTVLVVVSKFEVSEIDLSKKIILLDGIQDPGNLGTIVRTADWFGIYQIVCSKNTVDFYNPKVLHATMGSFMRTTIQYLDLYEFINKCKVPIYGALMKGIPYQQIPSSDIQIILLGNEGKGISEELIPLIQKPITILGKGQAESLNVGIACGILLSYITNND